MGDRDDEVGDEESAPEAHDHAEDASHEAFLKQGHDRECAQGQKEGPNSFSQGRWVFRRLLL
jgi:hypothetical protein